MDELSQAADAALVTNLPDGLRALIDRLLLRGLSGRAILELIQLSVSKLHGDEASRGQLVLLACKAYLDSKVK